MINSLHLNEFCEKRLFEIASGREEDYVAHFQRTKEQKDMTGFFSRVAARITGHFSPELDMQGIPQPGDIVVILPLTDYTLSVMKTTKSAIEKFTVR